ncbi:unnamed protein product [Rhizophagus irregularis]|nr:unnamed protein product [Rhizophagus irregularis]
MLAVNKAQIKIFSSHLGIVLRIFRLIRIFFTAVIVIDFRLRNILLSHTPDIATRARAVPIYATTSFTFKNVEHAANVFGDNPTSSVFEQRMAALEGGTNAIFTPSGQAAQFVAISTICSVTLPRLGINVKFVQGDDPEEFARLIHDKTKAIYLDSMGNPKFNIPDFAICKIAHVAGIPVIIDNTFGAGKYCYSRRNEMIGGHGTTIGGVVINGEFIDKPKTL